MQQGAWGVSCRFGMREICIAIGQLTALPLKLCPPLFPMAAGHYLIRLRASCEAAAIGI